METRQLSTCAVALVALALMSSSVDGFFFQSLQGLYTDLASRPWESLSLVALKSYLFGQLTGRLAAYRHYTQLNSPIYQQQRARDAHNAPATPSSGTFIQHLQDQLRPQPPMPVHNRPVRSASDKQESDDGLSNQEFLEIITKLDVNKCIPRLLCEVTSGVRITKNGQFEFMVDKVFGEEQPEVVIPDQQLFSSIYHYAAYMGKNVRTSEDCRQLFRKCKSPSSDYRKMAEQVFSEK